MQPPDETLDRLELDDLAIDEADFGIRPLELRLRELVRHVAVLVARLDDAQTLAVGVVHEVTSLRERVAALESREREGRRSRERVDQLDERLDLAESHARDQDAGRRREVDALGETIHALIREVDNIAARTRQLDDRQ